MSSATFIKMRVHNAEQFREAPSRTIGNTSLYLTFGKVDAWANDLNPDIANTSVATENGIWYNMIGAKKLFASDIAHVVPRYNWAANTKFVAYDDQNINLYSANVNFYIVTGDYNVYKCIANANSSNSTVEPTGVNPISLNQTADGYIWKYMYTIADSDQIRFTNSQYMPVRKISADDGSLQWQVQDQVVAGEINSIVLTNGGVGYSNTSNIVVTIAGDGTSAVATASVNTTTNSISSIAVSDYGYGYTYATVSITGGGGSGANARPIISPPGGHGSNPLYELGGAYVMVNALLKNTEEDTFPVTNDFRQIALIKDPLKPDGNVSSNLKAVQAYTITTIGTGDYIQDEIVYQGGAYATSSFNGKIVSWDSTNGVAIIINTTGTPTSQSLVGVNSSTSRFVTSINDPDLVKQTGQILYVDNILPITRAADQTEDFKIVIKF
jgi:hypothetical protein